MSDTSHPLFYATLYNISFTYNAHLFADLLTVRDRNVDELSGGELQRFACAVVCIQQADV